MWAKEQSYARHTLGLFIAFKLLLLNYSRPSPTPALNSLTLANLGQNWARVVVGQKLGLMKG